MNLLKLLAGGIAFSPLLGLAAFARRKGAFATGPFSGITDARFKALLDTNSPKVFQLIKDVVGKCVLKKILDYF